jgi:hypothetical protein
MARRTTLALRRTFSEHHIGLTVLLAVISLAVVYLITANVILRTRLLRDMVSEGDDIELTYASAYSVWPGRVQIRGLSLAVQGDDMQMAVLADSGVVNVSLHDLLFKRFHATSVSLEGLSFRFRPRVDAAQAGSARVASFPTIPSFADPPVRVGEKPSPVKDEEDDLWQIRLDDVRAEIRELWFFEYRYSGAGRISRGGFLLQPGRNFAVYPARVELERGVVSVGNDVAAPHLQLAIEGNVQYTDVRTAEGPALADTMSGRLTIDAHDVNLAALDTDAEGSQRGRVEGRADLTVAVSISAGRLDPDGSAELTANGLTLAAPIGKLSGDLSSSLKSQPGGLVEWVTTSPRLALINASRHPGPVIDTPRLSITFHSETVGRSPSLREVRLDVPQLLVPSLRWARRWLEGAGVPIEIGGRLEGRAHLSWVASSGPTARLHLRLADAELSTEKVRASLGGDIDAKLDPAAHGASSSGRLDIELDGVEVERGRERTKPFRAAVRLPDLKVALEPEPAFSASIDVSAKPADSLLSLAIGSSMLKGLAADLFDLNGLVALARVSVSKRSMRFELARAQSGGLKGAGYWQRPAFGDATGAFLISSKVANVGISLVGSDTEMAWFVADDWLASSREEKVNRQDAKPAKQRPEREKK